MKQLVVVAVGGNSIIRDNQSQSIAHQEAAIAHLAAALHDMAADYQIVLTHGNGPQVGLDLRRAEIAHQQEGLPLTPLANCVADTQGGIGYLIQQALNNQFAAEQGREAVTLITQVEVDPNDAHFRQPSKPIGAFFSAQEMAAMQQAHPAWQFVEDAGRGYRRVVASPLPLRIVEAQAISALLAKGMIVIAAGGGGIPVIRDAGQHYHSVDAVIDKDLSTALLAKQLGADTLLITTGVEKVCLFFGQPNQLALGEVTAAEMADYLAQGHFPPGSMAPKIAASLDFLQHGGKRVIITTPEKMSDALRGATGTHIVNR